MHVMMCSTRAYDREYFEAVAAKSPHQFTYIEAKLNKETAALAQGYPAVCVFVNDQVDAEVLDVLHAGGTRFIVLRCAGYNNVDLATAARYGMQVARVPAYSPHAVAEHAVAMILCLNRRIHRAYMRVREGNFSLNGLIGFDLAGKTVGVVGTGAIGTVFCRIMQGFDCKVIAYDIKPNDQCRGLGVEYVELDRLWADSDIISLHCPLTPATRHLIGARAIAHMRRGVMLINTSRGAVIDTQALIKGLKQGHVGFVGLDVYEEEAGVFFEDLSNEVIPDDLLARLLTFPNVLITGHQGFLTHEALKAIAETTIRNLTELESRGTCANCLAVEG